jgi:hypothetical protein
MTGLELIKSIEVLTELYALSLEDHNVKLSEIIENKLKELIAKL